MAKSDSHLDIAGRADRLLTEHLPGKLTGALQRCPFDSPVHSEAGRWVDSPIDRWSDGFWAGLFWLAWQKFGDSLYREAAESSLASLADRRSHPSANYDLGFLYYYSFARGHHATGKAAYREVALAAAEQLCGYLHSQADVITITYPERIAAFGQPRVTTKIDVMMNLTLLWWAHAVTGERHFLDVALAHSRRSLEVLVRPDGSAWELADFDPESGELLLRDSLQVGPRIGCWARGQAWAFYGFLQAYRFTGDDAFLDAVKRAIAFWQHHIPPEGIPCWDLLAPAEERDAHDASAAAIVLAGLVRARRWGIDLPQGDELIERSLVGLESRLAPPDHDGLLAGGCAYHFKGEGLHGATAWGDYYLVEALVADGTSLE